MEALIIILVLAPFCYMFYLMESAIRAGEKVEKEVRAKGEDFSLNIELFGINIKF